jgi:hypothetical protein
MTAAAPMASFADNALADLCAALLPPEAGGPDPDRLAGLVRAYLDQLPPPSRSAAIKGIAALDIGLRAAVGLRPLRSLPHERRARLLERAMDLRPEAYAAVEGIKAVVLLAHGANANAAKVRARATRFEPARPDPVLDVTPSSQWPSSSTADVVVIGSGAGGAMAARTLARAGWSVVVVEEGRRWSVDDFRSMAPLDRYAQLYRDAGSTMTMGWPPVVLPIGRAVGGTTVVNSGTCYRPPVEVLHRWRDEFGLGFAEPDRIDPYFDEVERTLSVAPAPLDVLGANGKLALAGARTLGWSAAPIPRNAPDCAGSCQCALGCPRNAKAGVHMNALPQACEAGARIVSEARVRRVLHERGRSTGVLVERPDGSTLTINSDTVVVAAGAAETPALLVRSGLDGHPELGRNLAIHPALSAAGRFEAPVVAWEGVLQSAAVEQWHASHSILIEATATPPGMGSMLLPGVGATLLAAIEGADHLASLGAMIGDESSGSVRTVKGRPVMRYDLAHRDARRLVVALSAMGRVLFAAGATEVLTGVPGKPPVRTVAQLDDVLADANPRHLHLAAFHPTGTARAGSDDARCPVDEQGRLRGVAGVRVVDACLLPSCPEVNPQVSIMALALSVADALVEEHRA